MPELPKAGSIDEQEQAERWGAWLRERRRSQHQTQRILAVLVGTTRHAIGRMERGQEYPNVNHPDGLRVLEELSRELRADED